MGNKYFDLIKQRNDIYIFNLINVSFWGGVNKFFKIAYTGTNVILFFMLPMLITGIVYEYLWRRRQKRRQQEKQQSTEQHG
jgi:nicotinamide riboside transporter PnuC